MNLPDITILNAMYLRESSRIELSLRLGAIPALRADWEWAKPGSLQTADLRRLVAAMVD